MTYIVAWRWNGKECEQRFTSYILAMKEIWRLQESGMEPTLHSKE